jgi:hypothetical protein
VCVEYHVAESHATNTDIGDWLRRAFLPEYSISPKTDI